MRLNIAIVGLGNIGSIHYRIYKQIKEIAKIYLVDINPAKLAKFPESSFRDYRNLLGKVDLVSIATPTHLHFEITRFFVANKVPVLVEKPIASTLRQASNLIRLSNKKRTLLFVGHVERYNSAYLAIKKLIRKPAFIECHRLNPYPHRSLDTSVIVDLMIHDLDIILDLVKDKILKIEAKGVKVLSRTEDIANVRLTFKGGCVANISSSRISVKKERKIRIFMENCYISLDYANQTVEIYQKKKENIVKKILPIDKTQPLQKELCEFVNLVKKDAFTIKHAQKAKNALELSLKIQKKIEREKHSYHCR